MELRHLYPLPNVEVDLARSMRDASPMHYIFKIESFSLLLEIICKTGLETYKSTNFEACGYNWRLKLYPNGNKRNNGNGYISLYLVMAETNKLSPGFKVNVILNFFVYNHIRDKYLSIRDERVRRYHAVKKECGIPQLLPLDTFKDISNGYLVDDCSVFGAEVFVINCKGQGESLSIIKEPDNSTFTWRIDKVSGWSQELYFSGLFTVEGSQWKLCIYPNGDSKERGKSLSFYMTLHDYSNLPSGWRLYVEFKLCIHDQCHGNHYEQTSNGWLCAATTRWVLHHLCH